MRLIVAGGRHYTDYKQVRKALDYFLSQTTEPVEIVSGACSTGTLTFTRPDGTMVCGADGLGERYAEEKRLAVKYFPADWEHNGKAAGYMRNKDMAQYGTHCALFWDGVSKGTESMRDLATQYGLKLRIVKYQK